METDLGIFKTCADATRLRVLFLLAGCELCVCELVEVLQMPQGRISRHLAVLKGAGMVCDRREGTWIYYSLKEADTLLEKQLHAYLKARGFTVMMWGDQLLAEHNGKPPYNTAKALPEIPRDIVMCDWHYSAWEDFPSVRFFRDNGFRVIACGWFDPTNVTNFARVAAEAGCEGYCMTTWWPVEGLATTARTAAAIALSAQFAWAPKRFTLATVPWHPVQAFRRHHFPPPPQGVYRALDLTSQARTPLERTDLAAAPRGELQAEGVPFFVGDHAVVLDAQHPSAWQVAVGGNVAALHFLHCTTRPPIEVDHLYDRQGMLPKRVGHYVITYADESTETATLTYRAQVTQWNDKLGAADLAYQRVRDDGALVTLCAWEWVNPHPEKAVAAVDFHRDSDLVDLIILAVTARQ